ncbi:Capsule polysaccharide biosynthesis protein [Tistlia consotensis]|uniref:Capsule polysaccharide biosynthesis protein n=1 Tax=Tistlia consotensis USBA 355 TaxID=560819 RepID=A0A1Y6B8H2_9PROT|nr:capsule biosynthesis protein [Tistlia consotensis]SME98379.1 Capsule polysaccharide biosynthesis protein [Tistlia consotensis USBA 355]SNR57749.1 Capsule polysaccharide biosynthesis protein [Tistlia consotensis]
MAAREAAKALKARLRSLPGMRQVRMARLRHIARHGGHPDWRRLIGDDWPAWEAARGAAAGPRVLVATGIGGHLGLAGLDALLGVALTLRGAQVDFLLCDEALPACQMAEAGWYPDPARFVRKGPSELCGQCYAPAAAGFRSSGLAVETYDGWLSEADRRLAADLAARTPAEGLAAVRLDDAPLGEQALAGALRFFAKGSLAGEPSGEAVLRRFLHAALLTYLAMKRLVSERGYEVVVAHHGIYVPQGPAALGAAAGGARIVTWNPAYRRHCFIFSHDDTYHHTLMAEPAEAWQDLALSPAQEAEIVGYLKSRWTGSGDWIFFHERPTFDGSAIGRELGLDPEKPTIGLLTNVVWDAQLHYPANAFGSMMEWVEASIRAFAERPDLQLAIRVHPAEIRGTPASRQRVVEEIGKRFSRLPENVFIVPPESPISTYALLELCDSALIYGTKMGVELTAMGIPTIVAGEAWIRNKGLTRDADSPAHYRELLESLPAGRRLDRETVARARRYAYHFFFRRMIPLPFMEPTGGWPPYRPELSGLAALRPGATPGLDTVCDGILEGRPFVFPAERQQPAAVPTPAEAR